MDNPVARNKRPLLRGSFRALAHTTRHVTTAGDVERRRDKDSTLKHTDAEDDLDSHKYGAREVNEEATHEGEFSEHLNMVKKRTFRGKKEGDFVHWYVRRKGKADDNTTKFHGIMAYHGYKPTKSTEDSHEYEGEDDYHKHRFTAHVDRDGEVNHIQHHESFKNVNEGTANSTHNDSGQEWGSPEALKSFKQKYHPKGFKSGKQEIDRLKRKEEKSKGMNEMKTYNGKPLRDIAPKSKKFEAETNDHSDGNFQKTDGMKKLLAKMTVSSHPDRNGNEDGFASVKSPKSKHPAPNVGVKTGMEKIKREKGDLLESKSAYSEEEAEDERWNAHQEKIHGRLHKHWLKNNVNWTPHLLKAPSGRIHSMIQHGDGSMSSGSDHLKTLKEETELDEISKKTLGSYIKKAHRDGANHVGDNVEADLKGGDEYMEYRDRKANNRDRGIKRAVDRLTKEEVELQEKNWIAGAIKHPGSEKRAAKNAGESTHEYMEDHKDSPGKVGARARLGLRLSKMNKEEFEQVDEISKELAGDYIEHAHGDTRGLRRGDGGPTGSDRVHNAKRTRGIGQAVRKLTGKARVPAKDKEN